MIYCDIEISNKCNLDCSYCFLKQSNSIPKANNLETQDLDKRINLINDRLRDLKQKELVVEFSGGEPLLEIENIKYVVKKFIDSDIKVKYSMVTNGTLLSKKNYQYLMNKNFLLGISIDGDEKSHDKSRVFRGNNQGTFAIVKKT